MSTATTTDDVIRKHYREVAEKYGLGSNSTMEDETIRDGELRLIAAFVAGLGRVSKRVLDLGCGNGYALEMLHRSHPRHRYTGVDFSTDLLALARRRDLGKTALVQGDVRALPFADASFDAVYSERCLINILDQQGQHQGVREVHRVLRPGGLFLMIECFTDGLDRMNRARQDCGLPDIPEAYHNKYFDKPAFLRTVAPLFEIVDLERATGGKGRGFVPNFLSTHYFISRVLYPAVLKGELVRNAEFVKFFSFLPPIGEYAPLQAYLLKKKGGGAKKAAKKGKRRP